MHKRHRYNAIRRQFMPKWLWLMCFDDGVKKVLFALIFFLPIGAIKPPQKTHFSTGDFFCSCNRWIFNWIKACVWSAIQRLLIVSRWGCQTVIITSALRRRTKNPNLRILSFNIFPPSAPVPDSVIGQFGLSLSLFFSHSLSLFSDHTV